jgi:hypothetical protein
LPPPICRVLLFSLVVASAAACGNSDVVTESYATLEEATKAGAIERGWVPDGLPDGTFELREAHDLDSNRQWGLFSFPQAQAESLHRLLDSEEASVAGMTIDIPGRVEWWPVLLRGSLDPEKIRSTGLRAYRSKNGQRVFLVNWEQGRAYYWAVGE